MRIVYLLAPGVHLLDVAGPAQAFGTAADLTTTAIDQFFVAESPAVVSHQGLGLTVTNIAETWPTLDPDDLIMVPGWRVNSGSGADSTAMGARVPFSTQTLAKLSQHHAAGGSVASVCSGAFALAATGLLDDRVATTHHDLQNELQRRHPRVRVRADVLYILGDRVHTSAGIASGIDLSLALIGAMFAPRIAAAVARTLVVFARRNGDDAQVSVLLQYRGHIDELVHRTQDLIEERFREPLPLALLAELAHCSPRTLSRAFMSATGLTPLRYQQALRRERATHLIAAGTSRERAAREVGFEDARTLRRLLATE